MKFDNNSTIRSSQKSPLAMAEWIEIKNSAVFPKATQVSASDGGVD